jgi:geranylgeranyl pyrophosphate synthase
MDGWVEALVWTLLGVVSGYVLVFLRKRLGGMNEMARIKESLSGFVSEDKRIHAMFPPSYLGTVEVSAPKYEGDWLSVSAGGAVEVKAEIEKRIEKAAILSPEFADALRYAFTKTGKMVRSRLVVLLGDALEVSDTRKLVLLAQAVELLHCASLLHDDVVDEADMRRGVESLRKKFGDRSAVLTGDKLISLLVDVLTDIGNMDVTATISGSIEALVIGELLQLMASDSRVHALDPILFPQSESEGFPPILTGRIMIYLRKSFFKTGSLFAALARCVGLLTGKDPDRLASFGFYFGLAFQLVDDLLDLETDDEDHVIGKPVGGSDIRNGTLTLPVLLATRSEKLLPLERIELEKMIKRRFKLGGDAERALVLVAKSDCVEKSKRIVSHYIGRCRAELVHVIGEERMGALDGLLRDFESRRS